MNLNRRIEALEEKTGLPVSDRYHVIILADGESNKDATQRYCRKNEFSIEQLKHVIHMRHEDAACL